MTISVIGTTDSIQVVLDAAPATTQLPCTVSYVDQNSSIGGNSVNTNGTTAVTLVASPGTGINRVVGSIAIPNVDTATRIVTVNRVVSGVANRIIRVSLPVGYHLFYDNNGGWRVLDTNGNFLETVTVASGLLTVSSFILSSTLLLTNTTASTFGSSLAYTKLRFCKVDLFGYTNTSACALTFKDGAGTQISQIQIPSISTATTSFGIWFSDSLNAPMNNTAAGCSIQLSTGPGVGSVAVQIGFSN